MLDRWDWYVNNIGTFVNLLREQGYSEEEISDLLKRKRLLGFESIEKFQEYVNDITTIIREIESTTPVKNLRVVLQGSNITGYSANPLKGSRFLPDYVYDAKLGSDLDFRILGDNIPELINELRNKGIQVSTKVGGGRDHILEPDDVLTVFPQWKSLIDKHNGALQVIVFLKNVSFYTCPWEYELNLREL